MIKKNAEKSAFFLYVCVNSKKIVEIGKKPLRRFVFLGIIKLS